MEKRIGEERLGHIWQLGGLKRYRLLDGRAKGVECVDVDCGELRFTVLVDRGLDIHQLSFRGRNISYLSPNGIVSPFLCDPAAPAGDGFLRGFPGGFLCTCGVRQVGDPCDFEGERHGLHGRHSMTPAEDVCVLRDGLRLRVSGAIRDTSVLGACLAVHRTIECAIGGREIALTDRIVNEGGVRAPFMLLYHINFGHPFLSEHTAIELPSVAVAGYDEAAEAEKDTWNRMEPPAIGAQERVFFHDCAADPDGRVRIALTGDGHCVGIDYDKSVFTNLAQWKYPRAHDYAMAFEPCNNHVRGLAYEAEHGDLQWLEPGEQLETTTFFRFE